MITKWIKKAIMEYKIALEKPKYVMDKLPTDYTIEPINFCNLACPACSTSSIKENKTWMTLEQFKTLAEQLPRGANIYFFHYGEPFLNPDMIRIIKEAKSRDLYIYIHSNFNFKSSLVPEIVDSGLDFLSASIDGVSKETYDKFRKKGNFELAWNNFEELCRLREERNRYDMTLVWQFIVHRKNEHEMKSAKRIAKSLPSKPRLAFIPIGLREEIVEFDQYGHDELESLKKEWLPTNKKYISRHLLNNNNKAIIEDRRCPFLWNSVVLSVHGVLTPCCFTYKDEHAFGSIKESTISEIWNNEKYVSSRRYMSDPKYNDCNTICTHCKNFLRTEHKGNFIETLNYLKLLIYKTTQKIKFSS